MSGIIVKLGNKTHIIALRFDYNTYNASVALNLRLYACDSVRECLPFLQTIQTQLTIIVKLFIKTTTKLISEKQQKNFCENEE